jgi:capsular exopolysaccharide synthesis family protein
LTSLIATTIVVKLVVPAKFKSTVEILVYDPQRQIDTTIQKPISPFVDAVGYEAMSTVINILKSKSVALRVARELGLDTDPEFQSGVLPASDLIKRFGVADLSKRLAGSGLAKRLHIAEWIGRLGPIDASDADKPPKSATDERAEKLDRAADQLIERLEIWPEAYVIFVSATARDPMKTQRLASTVANEYLASQREARQDALEHVSAWLKSRMDNLQNRVADNEARMEKLKEENGLRDAELDAAKEQDIRDFEAQLLVARQEVSDRSTRLKQARHVLDTHGDIETIPELTESAPLAELHRKKMELNLTLADLQNRLGERSPPLVSVRAGLAEVDKQMEVEARKIFVTMSDAYTLAVQREQSLEARLQTLNASRHSETYVKMQQLRHMIDEDHRDYQSYLSQYNDVSEQKEAQYTSARIISPATLPRSPTSGRMKFYAVGGVAGLGIGLLLAFLLECMKPGVRTSAEVEYSLGLPVLGLLPIVSRRASDRTSPYEPLLRKIGEPFSHLATAVQSLRINLELLGSRPKVILITSALPGEGKSTAAMLLTASSAAAGKRAILIDCDLRRRSSSKAFLGKPEAGLTEVLRGAAQVEDVVVVAPRTKISVISAGSMASDAGDLLISNRMRDLISSLQLEFDYIVLDGPPLLPVVDARALAALADKVLLVAEWGRTARATLSEASRALAPAADRVAGVVLNKVNFLELSRYGDRYQYRSLVNYYGD